VFRRMFAESSTVLIPKVYWTFSSERVLTLERIEGTTLSDTDLSALGPAERRRLAHLMAEVWLEMVFRYGTFHADPHPANLFVMEDGRRGSVDIRITGTLSPTALARTQ